MTKLIGQVGAHSARLSDYEALWSNEWHGPSLHNRPDHCVTGVLVPDTDAVRYLLTALDTSSNEVCVDTGAERVTALAYSHDTSAKEEWQPKDWAARFGPVMERALQQTFTRRDVDSAEIAARRLPLNVQRTSSWLLAQTGDAPTGVGSHFRARDVITETVVQPYEDFFAVEEQHQRFPLHGGGLSNSVKRAAFVMSDAVTVMPYDPIKDRVLVIEQFRFGPLVRGDNRPWSVEPIAGRVDPGETPQDAARREAKEEAEVDLTELELIAEYYPSPGAITEYLYSFVALCDLHDDAARVAGVPGEAEDIRGILLDFSDLLSLVEAGGARNGPLLLSTYWLAANRDRLRSKAAANRR